LKTFIPVSRIFDNEDVIFIFSRNVRKYSASENYLGIRKFEFVAKTQKQRDLPRRIPVMMSKASNGVENLKSSITPTEGGAAGLSSFFSSGLSS